MSSVTRERGLDLTCLGYGGQCHIDPMIARMIHDLRADFIFACFAVNVLGAASIGPRAFRPAVGGQGSALELAAMRTPIRRGAVLRDGDRSFDQFDLLHEARGGPGARASRPPQSGHRSRM